MNRRSGQSLLTPRATLRGVYLLAVAVALAACGGGSSSSNTTSYTVGGSISGLSSGSVVLVFNGSTTVTVTAGATTWVFPGSFPANSSYSVGVESQPAGQLCAVTGDASGASLAGNLDDVTVVCSDFGDWIWEGGLNSVNASGAYGTQGASSANNLPGGRYSASSWTDSSGNLWLFGGTGYDSSGAVGSLNDLWQYSSSTGQWTWVSGASGHNAVGVYGTEGSAAASNIPGARYGASSWIDSSGDLWLFGGYGYAATGGAGELNDLWRYTPSTGQWTWVSGGNADNASGVYGTQGTGSVSNIPGARYAASAWTDSAGNLWLFGGYGFDTAGSVGELNDLWRYTPSTGQWTWVSGGSGESAAGVYGTQATASAANVPGARQAASAWTDSSGKLWMFGGYGYGATGGLGYLNDLWQYSTSTGEWTWVSGGSGNNTSGVYGTQGTAASGNVPGSRQAASSWIDSSGRLWLFGGYGDDATGGLGYLDDLWQYSPSTGLWTDVAGSTADNAAGVYGTQATISDGVPGGRQGATSWIDSSGKLWLFGGTGYGALANGYLNDLWQFVLP
ncbi:MAG TPA: kelch repeat-containing protein [Steroidobacteraceae bacterium]|jgi:N-acetylneuraminic acid mutarotase